MYHAVVNGDAAGVGIAQDLVNLGLRGAEDVEPQRVRHFTNLFVGSDVVSFDNGTNGTEEFLGEEGVGNFDIGNNGGGKFSSGEVAITAVGDGAGA